MKTACPICKKPVRWEENKDRPFCSERCKLIDLGHWSEGAYALPTNEVIETDEIIEEERAENQS